MRQLPRRCLALGNQFAQISSFFLRQLYDILLHGGLLLVEQWFGFSCSSRIPLFPSTHHFIMDRTLGTFFCLSFEAMRLHPLPYYHSYRPTIVTKTVTNFRTRGDFRRKGNLLNTMLRQSLFQQAAHLVGYRKRSHLSFHQAGALSSYYCHVGSARRYRRKSALGFDACHER